jgi:hypothetical protein
MLEEVDISIEKPRHSKHKMIATLVFSGTVWKPELVL